MSEEYYTSLGIYTHHLQELLQCGDELRSTAFKIETIVKTITTANYPFTEHNLPPKIDGDELLKLTDKLIKLNNEIEEHRTKANIHAKRANKKELERKDF